MYARKWLEYKTLVFRLARDGKWDHVGDERVKTWWDHILAVPVGQIIVKIIKA